MVRLSTYGFSVPVAAAYLWLLMPSCTTGDGGSFDGAGGSTSAGGTNSIAAGGDSGSGSSTSAATTGTGGVVAGTVNPDAGTFEPISTVDNPATPYVTTCDNCPASEPLKVQCSSGCCCAHYCAGQFGGLTDKPCCDAQGGVIGLNCVVQ